MQTQLQGSYVGRYYGERQIEVTPELVQHYAESVRDFNPWYSGDSPLGVAIIPALLLHSEVYRSIDWYLSIFGNLHARQEWELYHPIAVGDTVSVRRQIVERYVKRDRAYVVMEVDCYGKDGRLLNRGRTHQSFLLNPDDRSVTVVDKDREKRSDRRFEAPEGTAVEEIAGTQKDVTIEMCQLFSPGKSYHNDVDEARKLGFPDIVVQGMMSLCFLSEMMTERFGLGWFQGGKMNVNLVNVLWQGEKVTSRGVTVDQAAEGENLRANLRVWCEKADGTKIVAGTASALLLS